MGWEGSFTVHLHGQSARVDAVRGAVEDINIISMVYTLYFYIILSGRKVIETNKKLNNNVKIANNEGQI